MTKLAQYLIWGYDSPISWYIFSPLFKVESCLILIGEVKLNWSTATGSTLSAIGVLAH